MTPEQIIMSAWQHPDVRKWDPNKDSSCRVTLHRKPGVSAGGIILPPGALTGLPASSPTYDVEFRVEFGSISGAPAYQIIGTHAGTTVVVTEGSMERKGL